MFCFLLILTKSVKTAFLMRSFGEVIRAHRKSKKLPLRIVAAQLGIDQAILSKIERNQRRASREQVMKMADYFGISENELMVSWLSDKLVYEVAGEQMATEALQVAEEKVAFKETMRKDYKSTLVTLKEELQNFSEIKKAWVFGSFARACDQPTSDIDIAVECSDSFSYFDLAEIGYQLEKKLNRKIDVGFIDSIKSHVYETIQPELVLIFERKK